MTLFLLPLARLAVALCVGWVLMLARLAVALCVGWVLVIVLN